MWLISTASFSTFLLTAEVLTGAFVLYLIGLAVYNRYFHPYSRFPGPFWASITDIWYWRSIRYGIGENYQRQLHEKYGPMVRITPDYIQIADPAAIEVIYGARPTFAKGEFYDFSYSGISPRRGIFEERDEAKHTARRRIVAGLYTQGSILEFEPCVDRVIAHFREQMDNYVQNEQVFDMARWIQSYTFDVIGELFFGKEGGFGFVRDGVDYNNWQALFSGSMPTVVSSNIYLPKSLRTLYFMTQLLSKDARIGLQGHLDVIKDAHQAVKQRLEDEAAGNVKSRNDILSKLLEISREKGEKLNYTTLDVTTDVWTMIWAGADTTSVALTSVFYYLHKNPDKLEKLLDEIEVAFNTGALTMPIRYNDAIKLPYLHAVVRESMRMHASVGHGFPRVVPEGGVEICGEYFPGGYGVQMNTPVINFDKTIFGDDADYFIPERWLRDEKAAAYMDRHNLTFGYGPRICIGKYITTTEMYKLIPTIVRDFHFEFDTPDREWKTWKGWFQNQHDVNVRATRRKPKTPAVKQENFNE